MKTKTPAIISAALNSRILVLRILWY